MWPEQANEKIKVLQLSSSMLKSSPSSPPLPLYYVLWLMNALAIKLQLPLRYSDNDDNNNNDNIVRQQVDARSSSTCCWLIYSRRQTLEPSKKFQACASELTFAHWNLVFSWRVELVLDRFHDYDAQIMRISPHLISINRLCDTSATRRLAYPLGCLF